MKSMRNIRIYILIFLCVPFLKTSFSQNTNECRVYLNFPDHSFEISGGFSQLYKIGARYCLFSQECNSFMNFVFSNPRLNKLLFSDDKNACNVYYEKFFNRCRCDTTSFLYIYKSQEVSADVKKKAVFDKKIFEASLLEIRDSALKALSKAYPEYFIKIEITSAARSMNDQEKYLKKGSSKTLMWQVLDWNTPAIDFYKKYNAFLDQIWVNGHLTEDQINKFMPDANIFIN